MMWLSSRNFSTAIFIATLFNSVQFASAKGTDLTIWPEGTVAAMKQARADLFGTANKLYEQQHYYDDAVNCLIPLPPPQYGNGSQKCANANQLVTESYDDIADAWLVLAKAMFPPYYGLAYDPSGANASFADFTHYYNELTDMATTILNSTWLYLCKYDIYSPSAAYTAETTSNYYGHPEDVVFFGPRPFPKGSRGNGTLFAYPGRGKDSDFEWAINTSGVGYGSSKTAIDFMMENKMRYFLYAWDSNITCTEVEAGGVGKPVLPTS